MMWPPVPPLTPVEMRMGGSPSSGIRLMELPTGLPTVVTGVWATWGVEGHGLERTSRFNQEGGSKMRRGSQRSATPVASVSSNPTIAAALKLIRCLTCQTYLCVFRSGRFV